MFAQHVVVLGRGVDDRADIAHGEAARVARDAKLFDLEAPDRDRPPALDVARRSAHGAALAEHAARALRQIHVHEPQQRLAAGALERGLVPADPGHLDVHDIQRKHGRAGRLEERDRDGGSHAQHEQVKDGRHRETRQLL